MTGTKSAASSASFGAPGSLFPHISEDGGDSHRTDHRRASYRPGDPANGSSSLPSRRVVVDEAQDLSPAHSMLLRAMAAQGPNDIFLAGRIYDNYVSLGSLGIAIRGRSTRLAPSYRPTHEILWKYQQMIVAGVSDGMLPAARVERDCDTTTPELRAGDQAGTVIEVFSTTFT